MPAFASSPAPAMTLWGAPDTTDERLPGLWHVTTPSHGGFVLSDERQAAMPDCLRRDDPFYEEDVDWSLVVLAFAHEFRCVEDNFTFIESKAAGGAVGERDLAILRGRDEHGFDWDRAVAYADGWYAARAGWPYRGCSNANARALAIPSGRDKAYDDGFADGGGDRGDLFDVARRGNLAALRADNQRANARPRLPARPLPSSWPKPTDHARSTRWSRRLVVLSEVLTVEVEPGVFRSASLPMDLARLLARGECAGLVVVTLGNAGFSAGFRADGYGSPLSPTRADAIIADPAQLAALRTLVDGHEFDDVLIAAQGEYLRVIDAFAATLPLCRTMERTRNSLLLQRSQLQCWIDRGRSDESNTGAGHIRWGKAIKGLVGKLGEITVRHVGPAPGRGHLVRVEIGPGSLATGYVTPTGDLLEPELVVSNKANLRREMAAALRAFCGATRLT